MIKGESIYAAFIKQRIVSDRIYPIHHKGTSSAWIRHAVRPGSDDRWTDTRRAALTGKQAAGPPHGYPALEDVPYHAHPCLRGKYCPGPGALCARTALAVSHHQSRVDIAPGRFSHLWRFAASHAPARRLVECSTRRALALPGQRVCRLVVPCALHLASSASRLENTPRSH